MIKSFKLAGAFFLFSITFASFCSAQTKITGTAIKRTDYCNIDSAGAFALIGKHAKIYHAGGVYATLNQNEKRKWPSSEMKKLGGSNGWGNNKPEAGDTGTIVHVFIDDGSISKYIYVLKIKQFYVPISCSYLTDIDLLDSYAGFKERRYTDSIENIIYANGCKFRLINVEGGDWSRAGLMKIDRQSETFACALAEKGIDTVMLAKYIFDNGSSSYEKAFILWKDKGKGFIKAYFNTDKDTLAENEIVEFRVNDLFDYFFKTKIGEINSDPSPKAYISHNMGFSIQVYTPGSFFRERLQDYKIYSDKKHPKSVFGIMVENSLLPIQSAIKN